MADRTHKRWTLRRAMTRVVVLLVLGFIVNVLVAWGFAARSESSFLSASDAIVINFANVEHIGNGLTVMTRPTNYGAMTVETGVGAWRASTSAHYFDVPDMLAGANSCPGCIRPVDHPDVDKLRDSWRWRLVLPHAWLPHRCNTPDSMYQSVRGIAAFGWPLPSVVYARGGEISGDDVWRSDLFLWPALVQPGYAALALNTGSGVVFLAPGDLALIGGASYAASPYLSRYVRTIVLPLRPIAVGAAINSIFYAFLLSLALYGLPIARHIRRRRKGRCTRCGYDLLRDYASGCPECGWNKPDPHAVAT